MGKFDFLSREMVALAERVQKGIIDKRPAYFLMAPGGCMTTAIISDPAIAKLAAGGKRVALNHPALQWELEGLSGNTTEPDVVKITLRTVANRHSPITMHYIRKDTPFRQDYTQRWGLNKRVLIVEITPGHASVNLSFEYLIANDPTTYVENISWPSMERSSDSFMRIPAAAVPPGWQSMSAAQRQAAYAAAIGSGKTGMMGRQGLYQPATPQQGGNLYQPNRLGNIPGALATAMMAPNQMLPLSQAQFAGHSQAQVFTSSANFGTVILPPGHKQSPKGRP